MSISGEDIKNKVYRRLNQNGLATVETDNLIEDYIDDVITVLAADKWYHDLLKTKYLTTDSDGKFTIEDNVIPYITFAYGTEGERHTWQRLTPVDYEYFENWDSRVYRGTSYAGGGGGVRRRYSILPEGDADHTVMQILEIQESVSIKIIYYPIRPAVADFASYFEPLITNMVLEMYTMDKQDASKDRYVRMLQDQTKKLTKLLKKQAETFEINSATQTTKNAKTRDWLQAESNDIGYWVP